MSEQLKLFGIPVEISESPAMKDKVMLISKPVGNWYPDGAAEIFPNRIVVLDLAEKSMWVNKYIRMYFGFRLE